MNYYISDNSHPTRAHYNLCIKVTLVMILHMPGKDPAYPDSVVLSLFRMDIGVIAHGPHEVPDSGRARDQRTHLRVASSYCVFRSSSSSKNATRSGSSASRTVSSSLVGSLYLLREGSRAQWTRSRRWGEIRQRRLTTRSRGRHRVPTGDGSWAPIRGDPRFSSRR